MYLSGANSLCFFVFLAHALAISFEDWESLRVRGFDYSHDAPMTFRRFHANFNSLNLIHDLEDLQHNGRRLFNRGAKPSEKESSVGKESSAPHVMTPAEVDQSISRMTRISRNFRESSEVKRIASSFGDGMHHPDAKAHYFMVQGELRENLNKDVELLKNAGGARRNDYKRFKKAADRYVDAFGKFYDIWAAEHRKMKTDPSSLARLKVSSEFKQAIQAIKNVQEGKAGPGMFGEGPRVVVMNPHSTAAIILPGNKDPIRPSREDQTSAGRDTAKGSAKGPGKGRGSGGRGSGKDEAAQKGWKYLRDSQQA